VSFAESPVGAANVKERNPGLQSSVSVETCPGTEEIDDREFLRNRSI
jgi:hypothetical protein